MKDCELSTHRIILAAYNAILGEIRDEVVGIILYLQPTKATFYYYCLNPDESTEEMAQEVDTEFQAHFTTDEVESNYVIIASSNIPDYRDEHHQYLYLKRRSM